MSTIELEHIESVRIMRLEPGDIIVAKLSESHFAQDVRERIVEQLKAKFPDHEVLVTTPEIDMVSVARES